MHTHPTHTHRQYNEQFMTRYNSKIPKNSNLTPEPRDAADRNKSRRKKAEEEPKALEAPETPPPQHAPPPSPQRAPAALPPSRQWLGHQELHLIAWPHSCALEEAREVRGTEGIIALAL